MDIYHYVLAVPERVSSHLGYLRTAICSEMEFDFASSHAGSYRR